MRKINLREVAEYDIRSCNSCLARNYKSENLDHIGEYVEKLYSLDIGQMRVCLCIEKGNEITIYGTFNSEYCANNFMDELGKFIGAKFDCPTEKGGDKE